MNIDLNGRVAIITGATGGIGTAISYELYNSGATVILNGRNMEKLETLAHNLIANSPDTNRIACVKTDLEQNGAPNKIINKAIERFKHIDILVNNAALLSGGLIVQTDQANSERMMLLNYTVPYLLCQNALGYMKKQRWGRIINITSVAGQCGDRGMVAYASSKAALASLTKTICTEYARYNVTANSIAPGIVETSAIKLMKPEYVENIRKSIPAQRFGKPEEIAALVAFLSSQHGAYINGQEISVNGGLYR